MYERVLILVDLICAWIETFGSKRLRRIYSCFAINLCGCAVCSCTREANSSSECVGTRDWALRCARITISVAITIAIAARRCYCDYDYAITIGNARCRRMRRFKQADGILLRLETLKIRFTNK